MSESVFVWSERASLFHRCKPAESDASGLLYDYWRIDRKTAYMVALTPCRHCYPEAYDQ